MPGNNAIDTMFPIPPKDKKDSVWPGVLVLVGGIGVFIIGPASCGIVQTHRQAEEARQVEAATAGVCDLVPAASPIRTSLDARCDTLRCPPGTHAEWRPKFAGYAAPEPRCVEGP